MKYSKLRNIVIFIFYVVFAFLIYASYQVKDFSEQEDPGNIFLVLGIPTVILGMVFLFGCMLAVLNAIAGKKIFYKVGWIIFPTSVYLALELIDYFKN